MHISYCNLCATQHCRNAKMLMSTQLVCQFFRTLDAATGEVDMHRITLFTQLANPKDAVCLQEQVPVLIVAGVCSC